MDHRRRTAHEVAATATSNLSLERARAVKDHLTRRGVDASRVATRGLGPDYPVASNSTEAGRLQNRRVQVLVQTQVARLGGDRTIRE